MENTIETLSSAEQLKDTPSISEATPTIDKAETAIPLGEATPEIISEALKSETETVKNIGDDKKETATEDKKEDIKAIGDKTQEVIKEKEVSNIDDKEDSETIEFKVPEDSKSDNIQDKEQEEESSWIKAGKEVGIELKADDFEEFKAGILNKETVAYEKGKAEASKIDLEKFTPEAQKLIEFLNSDPNASVDDFLNPLKEMDAVLALDNEGIVRKDLELKGWDSDQIDTRIALLDKGDALDSTAYELRKMVEGNKIVVKNTLVDNKKFEAEERRNQYLTESKKENEQIKSAIEKTDTFLDGKLNKEVKDFLYKKWETGEYRKLIQTNPEIAVKSMLNHYLGEQAAKGLKKESFQKGRDNIQEKLHNLEQIGNGGETSGRKETKKVHANPFDAWSEGLSEGLGN